MTVKDLLKYEISISNQITVIRHSFILNDIEYTLDKNVPDIFNCGVYDSHVTLPNGCYSRKTNLEDL